MDSLLLRHRRQVRADTDLRNLQRELDALPPEDKGAYLAAVDPASDRPCRAEAEGRDGRGRNRHLAYLEGCNFDARAAARKVAQYWTERLELFGPARAFEPMSLRGVSSRVRCIMDFKDFIDYFLPFLYLFRASLVCYIGIPTFADIKRHTYTNFYISLDRTSLSSHRP